MTESDETTRVIRRKTVEEPDIKPVLSPTEIFGGEIIVLGRTKLKLVAFCGPTFSWD
jgi:hypothetical protein